MSPSGPEKIQLTAEDARFLRDEFAAAVAKKTSLHLPGNDPNDPLIRRVRELVEEFVTETMQLSRHALVVDGTDMEGVDNLDTHLRESTEQIEPFDLELAENLRKVYAQVDETTVQLSEMRKKTPQTVSRLYQESARFPDPKSLGEPVEGGIETIDIILEGLPPGSDLTEEEKASFMNSLQEIKRLRGSIPETANRLDELEKAKEVINGL